MSSAEATLNGELPIQNTMQVNGTSAEVHEFTKESVTEPVSVECDVLVVGAGFSGMTAIHRFRKLGLNVKCFESGEDFGGTWYWNRYPGARVDSECPFYQLNIPEIYEDWHFSHRFSDHTELRKYIAFVAKRLDLRKDTTFSARVNSATWDEAKGVWNVGTLQGHTAQAKYLMLASGLLHRTYTPDFPGLKDYKGEIYHSGAWPQDFDPKGKKIGLIGAGATAVQITQELGKTADELTVFVRRPSYCLAMGQRKWTKEEHLSWRSFYPTLFKNGRDSAAGFPLSRNLRHAVDVPAKEREALWNKLWEQGGFNYMMQNFGDVLVNPESNKLVYDYWRKRVCERLADPQKNKILAPETAPYPFGTRRPPLENDYYDVLNQKNVHVHSLQEAPLKTFTEKGMEMADGSKYEFDVVVLATGFDSFTGSVTQMGLKNRDGVDLKDVWKDSISTYLGLTIPGFPNMFMIYSPQAPTPLSNGTTIIEAQVETVVDYVAKLESEKAKALVPTEEAAAEWREVCDGMTKHTLLSGVDGWWNLANIPGKKAQNMIYLAGINTYEQECRKKMDGWKGFEVVSAA